MQEGHRRNISVCMPQQHITRLNGTSMLMGSISYCIVEGGGLDAIGKAALRGTAASLKRGHRYLAVKVAAADRVRWGGVRPSGKQRGPTMS